MGNPYNLPDSHWIFAKDKEDQIRRMIASNYDLKTIMIFWRLEENEVIEIANKFNLPLRDRAAATDFNLFKAGSPRLITKALRENQE